MLRLGRESYGVRAAARRHVCAAAAAAALSLPAAAHAAANVQAGTSFSPADAARTAMDVGGVWNGADEVTASSGDTFTLSLQNAGDDVAYDLDLEVTLPAGFTYVAGTATGLPGLTAAQAGTTLSFDVPPDTDLAVGANVDVSFGLTAATTVTAGTYQLQHAVTYGTSDGASDGSTNRMQAFMVLAGDSTLVITPATQLRAVADTATWDVIVTNTGLGGLFDIAVDESLLNPSPSGSLQITSMVVTAPAAPPANVVNFVATLPYLAPGESLTVQVEAQVLDCTDITNEVSTDDRTNATADQTLASVVLDLDQPLVAVAAPPVTLAYNAPVPVVVDVDSTSRGDAFDISLVTTIHTLGATVSNVGNGWTYDGAGTFTYTANGGDVPSGASADLTFDLQVTDPCVSDGSGTVFWNSSYFNGCGDPYGTPLVISSIAGPGDAPAISLEKTASVEFAETGQSLSYAITLSGTNTQFVQDDPLIVTDTLPADITGVVVGPAPPGTNVSCTGGCGAGDTITWEVPRALVAGGVALPIAFTAPADPCLGGTAFTNTASIAAQSTRGCPLGTSAAATIVLGNAPAPNTVDLTYTIAPAPDGIYESGGPDAAPVGSQAVGEGEPTLVTITYDFDAGAPGAWTGSTYRDDFGQAAIGGLPGQETVPGTLEASVDGGSFQPVPGPSVLQSAGNLRVDLAFLAGAAFADDANVAGHEAILRYRTTVPDADLGGAAQRSYLQRARLELNAAGGDNSCVGMSTVTYTLVDRMTAGRAVASVGLAMPSQLSLCEEFDLVLTVGNANVHDASNPLVTLGTLAATEYEYFTPQPAGYPAYGGTFDAGSVTYAENGGVDPRWTYTGGELTGTGTITVRVRRRADAGTAPTGFGAGIDFDDNQTQLAGARAFSGSGATAPVLIRPANLNLNVSPQTIQVVDERVEWVMYVGNGGIGTAFGTVLEDTLPEGLTVNVAETNAANPGFPVTVSPVGARERATWDLGAIAEGGSATVTLVVMVNTSVDCDNPLVRGDVDLGWGCDGAVAQTLSEVEPELRFPGGKLQSVHDTTASEAVLCDEGTITIIARNTGTPTLLDVEVTERLRPALSGLSLVAGTVEYSDDGGASWNGGADPAGAGGNADPYRWTGTEIPPLARIDPFVDDATPDVRIRFRATASETASTGDRTVEAGATAITSCGSAASSTGTGFEVPLREPSISVVKDGRNVTAGQASHVETIYAVPGEVVEWRVRITNSGDQIAKNVLLTDVLAGTGNTAATLTGPGHAGTAITSGVAVAINDVDPGQTLTYTVTETLGASCVDEPNTASVTWGCGAVQLTGPSSNTDVAQLVMRPTFGGAITQSFTPQPDGRLQVAIQVDSLGGRADDIVVTDALPPGVEIDTTFPPAASGDITVLALDATDPTTPIFTLTGSLDQGESATVRFRVRPAASGNPFDVQSDPFVNPETTGNGLDPSPPGSGANLVTVDFESACNEALQSTDSVTLDLPTPDLDVAVTPARQVLGDGTTGVYTFTITNSGDAGSVADDITFDYFAETGWTGVSVQVVTPGTGGTGGACGGGDCTPAQLGTLSAGQTMVIEITATANDNGGSLELLGTVAGSFTLDDGTDTGDDYSLDEARPKILGFQTTKSRVATSETYSSGGQVAIGEEVTWRLSARWFGGEPVTGALLRDSLPAGLGYVSHADQAGHDVGYAIAGDNPVTTGTVEFDVNDADLADGSGTFTVDLVTRVLNVAGNVSGASLRNDLGTTLDAFGETFASSDPADGFGGTEPDLHDQAAVTVIAPALSFDKQVRNVTQGSAFADGAEGLAGDVIEYRLAIANTGDAPAFDLAIDDVLGTTTKLVLQDGAGDGVDNDGDGANDDGTEGAYTIGAGIQDSVAFDDANTALVAGQSLGQLDPGETITLLYRAAVDISAVPSDALPNAADLAASTLSGDNGSQSSSPGSPGQPDGERQLTASDSEDVTVTSVALGKTLVTTAVGADASPDVLVGEQAEFELSVVLPSGTVPNLVVRDLLPRGLSLLETPAVTIGSAVNTGQPTIAPAGLPASGNPLTVTWDFGTFTVDPDPDETARTITITYTVQVRNIAGNQDGTDLVNDAMYQFDGGPVNMGSVTVTVREPAVAVTKDVAPAGPVDAGDTLTYTVTVENTGAAGAFDLDLVDTLPDGVTYVNGSTNGTAGPAIGEPEVSGSTLTWGRLQAPAAQDLDLGAGGTLTFEYQVTVDDDVEPGQTLANDAGATWTSLDGVTGPTDDGPTLGIPLDAIGSGLGERDGSDGAGGRNDYAADDASSVDVDDAVTVTKSSSGDTVAGGGFRVGDLITYTIDVDVQEGTLDSVRIEDALPAGLALFDFQAIAPASGTDGFTYTAPAGGNAPSAGATGTLTWTIGTLVNAGDALDTNDRLTLVYRARVLDTGGPGATPTTQTATNSALMRYENAAGGARATAPDDAPVDVKQPLLTIAKSLRAGQTVVEAGDTVAYRLVITNTGDAPGYNAVVRDRLPEGMRDATPATVAATLNGGAATLAQTYDGGTGVLRWTLTDAQAIDPGEQLVIDYDAVVDGDIGGGVTLTNTARVPEYASQPVASPDERRVYAGIGPVSTSVSTPVPSDMDKALTPSAANVGGTLTYTLTVPETPVDVALFDVNVLDSVPGRLTVTSVTTNGAALGSAVADDTAGNAVDVVFAEVPPGERAIVTIEAVVRNANGNQAGSTIDNGASYTWAMAPGGAAQPPIGSPTVTATVAEPVLTIDKVFTSQSLQDPGLGLQAGDTVTFTVTLTNTGDGAAHDVVIVDRADENLIAPVTAANPDDPGAPTDSGSSGGETTWTFDPVAGPLAAGASYAFDVTFTIGPMVLPFQQLENTGDVTWTSTAGANPDERDGSDGAGGLNDYAATDATPVTVTIASASITKALQPAGTTSFAPGEDAVYRLTVTSGQGQIDDLHVLDTLPAGLSYVSSTLAVTNFQRQGGGPVTILSGPSAGDTGALDFDLGDVASTGPDPTIVLDVTVRVQDVPGNVDGTTLTNDGRMQIEFPPGSGSMQEIPAISLPQVDVIEPALVIALDGPAAVDLGTRGPFAARVENTGTAPAHQPVIEVELPAGMRDSDPTASAITVSISGGRNLTLTEGVDYTASYDGGTGRLLVTLVSADGFIDLTETLTIDFQAALDDDAVDGTNYAPIGTVTDFASADTSGGGNADVRRYPAAFGGGSTGTANAATGDDGTDDAQLTVQAPVLAATKSVDMAVADPADALHYTVVVTNSGAADASDVTVVDDLDPNLSAGTLRNVTAVPAGGTLTFDGSAGANGTGIVRLEGYALPAGGSVTIEYDVDLPPVLPSGTVILNQARVTAAGFSPTFLSDSTSAGDDDGVEAGNDAGDPDDDDPVRTVVGSLPALAVLKTDAPFANAERTTPADPGDAVAAIRYTLTVTNSGNEDLVNAVLLDAIPSYTTYVAGTTTLNGAAVPDVGGTTPLVSGLAINTPGEPAGRIDVGEVVTVTFDVLVEDAVAAGTVISNQATLVGEGEGTGPVPPVPSDDPDTDTPDDPTDTVVGSAPVIDAQKLVLDDDGGDLLPGETLTYIITIANNGTTRATGVRFTDAIPAQTTYLPASITYDADGFGASAAVAQSDADDGDDGAFAGGAVSVSVGRIDPGDEVIVTFQVTVDGGTPVGTVLTNQGVVSTNELPDEPTDLDGDDGNGDQPTPIVVGSAPALVLTKRAVDLDGGAVDAGDVIEYVLSVRSIGAVPATNVVIADPVPPVPTTYAAGSTTLEGLALADAAGPASPLVAGVNVGDVAPGGMRTLRFRVAIPPGTPAGTTIDNQATYAAGGGLSGVSDSDLDDGVEGGNDPGDPNDDDPVRLQVGGAPGTARVEGLVWLDLDHDRAYDLGEEETREGWTVEILRNGAVVDATRTDANGTYAFAGLAPGSGYEIRFRHPTTGTVWGNPVSTAPGAATDDGTIAGLTLPSGTTVIDQNLPLDPSGVVYDAVTRELVEGALVSLTGPAGFDPDLHLLPGQQGQVTGADGFYRFDLVAGFPAGRYTIAIVPPTGYLPETPSTIIPPETGALDPTGLPAPVLVAPQPGAPQDGDVTTWYVSFTFAAGDPDVVNNHIPLDPVLADALLVRKTTPKLDVVRTELIPYTITMTNTTTATLTRIALHDVLPAGFKYVEDSAMLDGVPVAVGRNGRRLRVPGLDFGPGDERVLTMILVPGTGVGEGKYVNQAWAVSTAAGTRVSNIAEATVRIIPDPTFDCAEVIGTVFYDRNQNGYQDEGEPGIPGARIATVNGLLITVDEHGRYHIACAAVPHASRGSNFIVKLDERSLPTGYRITSENPRVVRLTRGKMTTANFGVAISRVARLDLSDAAFTPGETNPTEATVARIDRLVDELVATPSVLRVAYRHGSAAADEANGRLAAIDALVRERWKQEADRYPLILEWELVPVDGAAAVTPALPQRRTAPRPPIELDDAASGKVEHDSVVLTRPAPPNTEAVITTGAGEGAADAATPAPADAAAGGLSVPYRVTIDGQVVDDAAPAAVDQQRVDDLDLEAMDIRLRYDTGEQTPVLNVTAAPNAAAYGETVTFTLYSNYAAWIDRAEVRMFRGTASSRGEPFAVLPVGADGRATWTATGEKGDALKYAVRVYDPEGRFDETVALPLRVAPVVPGTSDPEGETLAGFGENHRVVTNIPVTGGAVTVDGDAVPDGSGVRFMQHDLPVDPNGRFVGQQILPPGKHTVLVSVIGDDGDGMGVARDVYIPDEQWFYVALADLTVGGNSASGPAPLVSGDRETDDSVYFNGRLAFYLKGYLKGDWILTASGDTREGDLGDMFSNFNDKDPRALLRRLDADRFYPVYGDDSTTIEDAPTNGKLYVRLERGNTFALWGNFYTRLTGTELAQIDRALYGAQVHYESDETTSHGEARTVVDGFAAQPETVAARDDFRGTGGSLYYLRHPDILVGSERLRVEIRDKDSGLVLEQRELRPYDDYDIDPLQGRILLRQPLPSTVNDDLTVRTGSLSGNLVFLVARYEYNPDLSNVDDMAFGGRATHWVGDHVQVGVTGGRQDAPEGTDQDLIGADVTARLTPETYIRGEFARTDGTGTGERTSISGGFDSRAVPQDLRPGVAANAWFVEGAVKLSDVFGEEMPGRVTGYWEDRGQGFSAPGQLTLVDTTKYGGLLELPFGERTRIDVKVDIVDEKRGIGTEAVQADLHHGFDENWYVDGGVRYDSVKDNAPVGTFVRDPREGSRTDASVQLGYDSGDTWDVYGFAQGTLSSSGDRLDNNRAGAGGNLRLNNRLTVGGEASGGTGGFGALVSTDYMITDRTSLYIGYESGTERTDYGSGGRTTTLTTGSRTRFNDNMSVFSERRRVEQDGPSGVTRLFGVDLSAADKWVVGVTFENGRLTDLYAGEVDRTAVSASVQYAGEHLDWAAVFEWGQDRGDRDDRTTWLFRNTLAYQADPSWRLLGKLNVAQSETSGDAFFEGSFLEGVVAAAYRPVKNDKLNALFKYTYFADEPPPGQVGRDGFALNFAQRSHILSIDATYDLFPQLSIGGKYGFRYGQLRSPKVGGRWFSSAAHLGILRADVHVVRNWDAIIEGRWLHATEASDDRYGVLVAVYRHINDNLKLGVGYNFTDFSDDLTDLSYDHQGWFVNVIAKF